MSTEELKKLEPHFELVEYAADKLKKAGFILHYTSMKSEACYYKYPGRDYLLRIACHRYGRTARKLDAFDLPTKVNLAFSPTYHPKSMQAVDNRIYQAVGKYFMITPTPITRLGEDYGKM